MTTPPAPPTVRVPQRVRRDRETIELYSDFLAASEIGLSRVEELLQQRSSPDAELAHELYRIFHAIKGVSTMLETADITRLAYACELLLAGARSERYPLSGQPMRVLAVATAAMGTLLTEVRRAVDLDTDIRPNEELSALLALLSAAAQSAERTSDAAGGEQ